jgi:hypothetical protein
MNRQDTKIMMVGTPSLELPALIVLKNEYYK